MKFHTSTLPEGRGCATLSLVYSDGMFDILPTLMQVWQQHRSQHVGTHDPDSQQVMDTLVNIGISFRKEDPVQAWVLVRVSIEPETLYGLQLHHPGTDDEVDRAVKDLLQSGSIRRRGDGYLEKTTGDTNV